MTGAFARNVTLTPSSLGCASCSPAQACAGEIAGKLFISVKTVDHHVSAVLAKLGAPTRGAAAARAAKLGLVPAAG